MLGALLAALLAEPALAAGSAKDVGKHLGELLSSWATYLFLGVLSLVVIPPLMKRDVGGGVVIVGMAILLGGFVFYKAGAADMIEGVWKTADTGR
jgi:predicted membrane channel-forming protein YqfA (hemolysin III family)